MSARKPRIIVIVGPTACGKTALGIELAKRLNGEIICADSRTVYRGMDIGTAKVVRDEVITDVVIATQSEAKGKQSRASIRDLFRAKPYLVEGIPHWGLDLADPDEEWNAAQFKTFAEETIQEILSRGKLPMIVGGTGMWIWALVDNLTFTQTPPNSELRAKLEARSLDDLFAEYKRLDPSGAEVIDRDNKRRVLRALEVTLETGKPFSEQMIKGEPKYDAVQIGIEVEREELNRRIDERVDVMIANGLVDEVRRLRDQYGCDSTAMSGIGYRQICFFLEGKANLAAAIEDTKKATRAYAKRQMTWFRRDPRIQWVSASSQAITIAENAVRL